MPAGKERKIEGEREASRGGINNDDNNQMANKKERRKCQLEF